MDWNAIYGEYHQRIEAGLEESEFYQAMREMIARLGDEHSVYLSPEEAAAADAEYAGDFEYVGIGVLTVIVPDRDRITIILVFPGSPAEDAGLVAHDNILAVDSQPILDETGFRRDLLRGPEGTSLELTVQSPGQLPRQVLLTRRQITGPLTVPYQVLTTSAGKRVGYILLPNFSDNNIDEGVEQALLAMSANGGLDGFILDNRFNIGGSSDVFSNTLAYFVDGFAGHFIDRRGERPMRVRGTNVNGSLDMPLVVLISRNTVSFGEIFAGILKDVGRAYLIGEDTVGNVEILYVYNFSDGSRAWIAHAAFRPLNHPEQDWEQTGISPHLPVVSNWDKVTLETDPAVQAALEYLNTR